MPKIQQLFEINVTPQKFLDRCSDQELYEVYLLMNQPAIHNRLAKFNCRPNGATAKRRLESFPQPDVNNI